ncbi:hypothetical protein E4U58_003298 [Claviceps cyperi]|nr:hypothetical protein E4U58_003298 [Claviceps cyperi]
MLPDRVEVDSPTELPGNIFSSHQMLHMEAYVVVHVDMIHRHEVAFKLTEDSIDALVRYHHDSHCANAKASTYEWSGKEQQCTERHKDFIQAINKFVFQTHTRALEGLEEEGGGELLEGRSEEGQESSHGPHEAFAASLFSSRHPSCSSASAVPIPCWQQHVDADCILPGAALGSHRLQSRVKCPSVH